METLRIKYIDKYTVICHNTKRKTNKRRVKGDVAIFLNKEFTEAYKKRCAPKPLITSDGEFEGRCIGIQLQLYLYSWISYGEDLSVAPVLGL